MELKIVKLLKRSSDTKRITIELNIPASLQLIADINMIQTIIRNFISNAIKFIPANGIINIESKQIMNGVQISIKDTGIGMTDEVINKLFKVGESTSTKGTNGESSSGLGLILCKEFVEKHGGKIWAESEEGKGSTFYFTLPKVS